MSELPTAAAILAQPATVEFPTRTHVAAFDRVCRKCGGTIRAGVKFRMLSGTTGGEPYYKAVHMACDPTPSEAAE